MASRLGREATPDVAGTSGPGSGPNGASAQAWRWLRVHRLSAAVLVLGLAAVGALTAASRTSFLHNEQRLTTLEARLTGSVLHVASVDVERRVRPAVTAAAYGGGAGAFGQALSDSMSPSGPFATAGLYRVGAGLPRQLVSLGTHPLVRPDSAGALALMHRALTAGGLAVTRVEGAGSQRFFYAMSADGPRGTYVATAEQSLPADHRVRLPLGSPVSDLRFALYLGNRPTRASLVETNAGRTPLTGTTAVDRISFGDALLTLVVAPEGSLSGTLAQSVAWWIAGAGTLLSVAAALLVGRLVRRRRLAEVLAAENAALYRAQRGVAETLQHSLLPAELPAGDDVEIDARYLPGSDEVEIGGDWYDVVTVDDHRLFFTVGDVAGRGLDAAMTMAFLRNAVTAYAVDRRDPEEVLSKLGRLVDVEADGRFATVVCGLLDRETGQVVLANAGHPDPVLVADGACRPVGMVHGGLVGIGGSYSPVPVSLPPGGTLLLYTDGLIERRGEAIDAGMARLCAVASRSLPLPALLDHVVGELVGTGTNDDVAVLGIRWRA